MPRPAPAEIGYRKVDDGDRIAQAVVNLFHSTGMKDLSGITVEKHPSILVWDATDAIPSAKIKRWIFLGYPPDTQVKLLHDSDYSQICLSLGDGKSVTYSQSFPEYEGCHIYISRDIAQDPNTHIISTKTKLLSAKLQALSTVFSGKSAAGAVFVGFAPQAFGDCSDFLFTPRKN